VQIPDFDGTVVTATDKNLPKWADSKGFEQVIIFQHGAYQFPSMQIPDFDGAASPATDKSLSIPADGQGLTPTVRIPL
jgi:hypothetical protein